MDFEAINKAQRLVSAELFAARAVLEGWVAEAPPAVQALAGRVLEQSGKKIRPLLTLLTAGACKKISEETVQAAAAVTAVHEASLLHDDVLDGARFRRGTPTLSVQSGNKQAILLGDYFLARAMEAAARQRTHDLWSTLARTVRVMAEGEIEQLALTQTTISDEDVCHRIIYKKTAVLFGACCKLGCASAGASPTQIEALQDAGEQLGIAFQIQDDCLDYTDQACGKPLLQDLGEGKPTLPLLYAFSRANASMQAHIQKVLRCAGTSTPASGSAKLVVRNFVRTCGALQAAQQVARHHAAKARSVFQTLPPSAHRDAICALAQF